MADASASRVPSRALVKRPSRALVKRQPAFRFFHVVGDPDPDAERYHEKIYWVKCKFCLAAIGEEKTKTLMHVGMISHLGSCCRPGASEAFEELAELRKPILRKRELLEKQRRERVLERGRAIIRRNKEIVRRNKDRKSVAGATPAPPLPVARPLFTQPPNAKRPPPPTTATTNTTDGTPNDSSNTAIGLLAECGDCEREERATKRPALRANCTQIHETASVAAKKSLVAAEGTVATPAPPVAHPLPVPPADAKRRPTTSECGPRRAKKRKKTRRIQLRTRGAIMLVTVRTVILLLLLLHPPWLPSMQQKQLWPWHKRRRLKQKLILICKQKPMKMNYKLLLQRNELRQVGVPPQEIDALLPLPSTTTTATNPVIAVAATTAEVEAHPPASTTGPGCSI
jgi:hypothetical protein